ncbi:MAG: ABC transporter permease [Verrucomicrobia bacterium]|nr:MAG: ABC transporter permease [Verrucomicrobiota bacterium]
MHKIVASLEQQDFSESGEQPETSENWTTTISPHGGLLRIPWREIWEYRELIRLFVHRDYTSIYKQTILGSFWHLVQPLLQTLMFILIFSKILKVSTDGIPPMLFFLSGIVCWRYFSECVNKTSMTFTANQHIFDKIYFPRLIVPISQVIVNLIGFSAQLGLFLGFYLFFYFSGAAIRPDWRLIVLPVLVFELAALGLGVGCLISALTTRYRDLSMGMAFLIQIWMYASCVAYPLSQVSPSIRWIIQLNPIVPIIEAFRYIFMGAGIVEFSQILSGALISAIIVIIGIMVFNKVERTSVDNV